MLVLKFAKLSEETLLPYRASEQAACYDAYCPIDIVLEPGKVTHIPLNFAVQCPEGYKLCVYNRSGQGKKGILLANSVGIVDEDYRGNVGVLLLNTTDENYHISKGDRICQLALEKVNHFTFEEVPYNELQVTVRGTGGFGHSGK